MQLDLVGYLVGFAALVIGGMVQGTLGFGLNVFALPFLIQVDPALVPVPVIVCSLPLTLVLIRTNWGEASYRDVGITALGRVPGLALGIYVATIVDPAALVLIAGLLVLGAVAVSLISWTPKRTPAALVTAGAVSSFGGVTAGIGGPPIALLYQHNTGPSLRGTLSMMNLVASLSVIATHGIAGRLTFDLVRAGLLLMPAPIVGLAAAIPLRSRIDGPRLQPAVLAVCAVSAVVALVRQFA